MQATSVAELVRMADRLSLASGKVLAPDIVKAAIEGRLPRSMGVARLCDMPAEWSWQDQMLGPHVTGSAIVEPVSA